MKALWSTNTTSASAVVRSPAESSRALEPADAAPPRSRGNDVGDTTSLRRWFGSIRDGNVRLNSIEEVLDAFVSPLKGCYDDRLPAQLRRASSSTAPCPGKQPLRVDASTALAAQEALLRTIVVDWGTALSEQGLWLPLLRTWFFGAGQRSTTSTPDASPHRGIAIVEVSPAEGAASVSEHPWTGSGGDQEEDGTLQLAGLRTLSALMLTGGGDRENHHPATRDAIIDVCREGARSFSLPSILRASLTDANLAKRALAWSEAVRLLFSIPDRLANYTRGDVPTALRPPAWISQVIVPGLADVLFLSAEIGSAAQGSKSDLQVCAAAPEILVRLDRSAYLSKPHGNSSAHEDAFWPCFAAACQRRSLPPSNSESEQHLLHPSVADAWSAIVAKCPLGVQQRLDSSLIDFLDSAARGKGLHHIVTHSERGQPGKEGSALLSRTSTEFIAEAYRSLSSFGAFRRDTRAESSGGSVGDEDSDEDEDETETNDLVRLPDQVFERVALAELDPKGLLSLRLAPAIGWVFAYWLLSEHEAGARKADGGDVLSVSLDATVRAWASRDRTRAAGLEQEQYLTLLLVSLLATQSPGSASVSRIASSPAFLDGVSCHLEHSDPHFRRTGMLVAELVSAKSKAEASTSQSDATPSKPLSFGRGIWDGRGQGKEEARVLRALHDAWPGHCRNIELRLQQPKSAANVWTQCLETLGIGVAEPSALSESARDSIVQPRAAPRSVRLPALRSPPARQAGASASLTRGTSRQLIVSLSEDEEEEKHDAGPLKMFSSSNSRTKQPDEASESSGDEDSSEDEEAVDRDRREKEDEVTRLAADLSGLSHDEASKLTRDAGLRGTQPGAPTGGDAFDTDREAHAPDFEKKKAVRTPVYINELAPLLKSDRRASIKVGLKSCAALLRRKAGWGGEVEENAVDLAFALCALQNNFGIRHLEERRTEALAALVVASPRTVGGCLAEQFFNHQYSMVQKLAMLNALAQGMSELAGRRPVARLEAGSKAGGGGGAMALPGQLAQEMTHAAIERARSEGERHVPAIQRSKNLSISSPSDRGSGNRAPLITPLNSNLSSTTLPGAKRSNSASHSAALSPLLAQLIHALLVRFSAHLSDLQTRRQTRRDHRNGTATGYLGVNVSGQFSPILVSALFDTLSVLLDLSSGSSVFRTETSPLAMEVGLSLVSDPLFLPPASNSGGGEVQADGSDAVGVGVGEEGGGGGRTKVFASVLSLLLIVLDRNAGQDDCSVILARSSHLVDGVRQVAETTFAISESRRTTATATTVGQDEARLARSCAAILLLLEEVREKRQRQIRERLGVAGF